MGFRGLARLALCLAAGLASAWFPPVSDDGPPGSGRPPLAPRGKASALADADVPPAGLTRQDWSRIRGVIESSSYQVSRVERQGLVAANRRQRYSTEFRPEGIEIASRPGPRKDWRLSLRVTGYGHAGDVRPVPPAEPQADEDGVEYRRGSLREWYVNRPGGLEQGFELQEPGPGRDDEPLVVAMTVDGDLDLTLEDDAAAFTDGSGSTLVRYAGLRAWDAAGRPLASRLESTRRELRVLVDAQEALFPVTIDPVFVHEAKLVGAGDPLFQDEVEFGYSVSVSGNTAVIGAPFEDDVDFPGVDLGAVYIFVRSGTTWSEQQKLTGFGGSGASGSFGYSVSISGDTAVVGDPYPTLFPDVFQGSAYVYVRSGTTWSLQASLAASDGLDNDSFGHSVSITGNTVLVGAPIRRRAYVYVRSGAAWSEQQILLPSGGSNGDRFGESVSVSGNIAMVGAPRDDTAGVDAGSAQVYVRSGATWSYEQKLTASDAASGDLFGSSVAVDVNWATIGAPADDTAGGADAGSAYVFVRIVLPFPPFVVWDEQQKLTASDGAADDHFGGAVSFSGTTAVVGARDDDTPSGSNAGSAYVFEHTGSTWIQQQKLVASDAASGDGLGFAVAVVGDTALVGAHLDDAAGGVDSGSAQVFVRSGTTWSSQQELVASDASIGDSFGFSVAVSGDTAVVGAPFDTTAAGQYAGSAYVFVKSGAAWSPQQKLLASDAAAGNSFGSSVSISGDTAVVGAPSNVTVAGAGSAYVFVRSGTAWSEQQKLVASDGANGDAFGMSISVAGDTALVGAPDTDLPGAVGAGSAYVFARSGTAWSEQQKLQASDAAGGDSLGRSVSVSGDTALAGAYLDDTPAGVDAGSAWVFVRSGTTWSEQQKLVAADGAPGDRLGFSVSASGETVVAGAYRDDTAGGSNAGSAYVFVRSGATWSQQQKLLAPDGLPDDLFGVSVSVSGDAIVVGASGDNTPAGSDAGSAHVFARSGTSWLWYQQLTAPDGAAVDSFGFSVSLSGGTTVIGALRDDLAPADDSGSAHVFKAPTSDLVVTKTDGVTGVPPGGSLVYSVVVSNAGPFAAAGAAVADAFPPALACTTTCSGTGGATCTPGPFGGNINDLVTIPVGQSATYTSSCTVSSSAVGTLSNTATVTAPLDRIDPDLANNVATDTDAVLPQADLSTTKTDGQDTAVPGQPVTYTISVGNAGPHVVAGATVTDNVPASLQGATWTCSASPGSSCTASGVGSIDDAVDLLVGGTLTYTLSGTLDPAATGTLVNTATATLPAGGTDPDPANDSATDTDMIQPAVLTIDGELVHGARGWHDLGALPGPVADEDLFLILQRPHASYEVLLDGASGDIGSGSGPLLERVAADGSTVLQSSAPAGAGGSRSLSFMNPLDTPVADELVRVRSAGCTTDCDAQDLYRLSALETTAFIPRFNNSATQVTVLLLQNLADASVDLDIRLWNGAGAPVGSVLQTLGPRGSYVLNTSTVAPGTGGSISVASTGRYGGLAGKAVAVEPATGFTFDTELRPRPR